MPAEIDIPFSSKTAHVFLGKILALLCEVGERSWLAGFFAAEVSLFGALKMTVT
jgi:hypothetical protein